MPPDLHELGRWIEKANHDLQTAVAVMELPCPVTDTAAFHCQQAVEKLLKAYLYWRERDFERVHDLRLLNLECAIFDDSFGLLTDRVAPLTAYAVRYRYPGPCDPTVDDVENAIRIAKDVMEFVLDRLPRSLRS